MKKIESLIKELCPGGVKYKRIDELFKLSRGIVISKDYIRDNPGEYPVYSSQTENNGELGKINTYQYDGQYITWTTDGYAGTVFYRTGKFSITNICGLLTPLSHNNNLKFIAYVLQMIAKKYVRKGVNPNAKLMTNVMAGIQIPIPPRAIQDEIVKILDNFTELTTELTTELKYRKQQYEYYRDKLLTFDDSKVNVEYKPLKELCSITTGKLDTKEKVEDGLYPFYTCNITPYKIDKFAFDAEAIIIAGSGSQLAHVHYYKGKFNANQRTYVLQGFKDVNSLFLMHYLKTYLRDYVYKFTINSVIPNITLPILQGFSIPLPPLPVQNRIAEVLNNFEQICHDLKIGLPSEISLRQKQYEYYRDRLLSFKEAK